MYLLAEKSMKKKPGFRNTRPFFYGIGIVLLTVVVLSCSKDQDEGNTEAFLVDYEPTAFFPLATVESYLALLLDEFPEASDIAEKARYGVQVYTLTYRTRYLGTVVTASGLVCMPMADETFPLISFQNGTNTAHDHAPTQDPYDQGYMLLEFMASNGYIILIPDYIGFGASDDILHPYYDRTATNQAVLDMIQAFEEMKDESNVVATSSGNIFLMGYSQGGWATLSVLDEMENGSTSDFNVTAVSCGAGAYDLMTMSDHVLGLETFPGPLYLPYFIYSQQNMGFIDDPLELFFKSPYAGYIPDLFDGSLSNDEVNAQLTEEMADLVTDALRENFQTAQDFGQLREVLERNSVPAWASGNRINFYHGTDDLNVPPEQSFAIHQGFLSAGAAAEKVRFFEMPGMDHGSGLIPWGIQTLTWFNSLNE